MPTTTSSSTSVSTSVSSSTSSSVSSSSSSSSISTSVSSSSSSTTRLSSFVTTSTPTTYTTLSSSYITTITPTPSTTVPLPSVSSICPSCVYINSKNETEYHAPNTSWTDGSCKNLKCVLSVNPCFPQNKSVQILTEHVICDKCPQGYQRPPSNFKDCCPPCEPIPNFNLSQTTGTCAVLKLKLDKIRDKSNCTSLRKYNFTQCRGHCDSVSTATYGDEGYESSCNCCQPEDVERFNNVVLKCPNGETRRTNFMEIKTCKCRPARCITVPDKSGMLETNPQGQVFESNQQQNVRKRRR